MSDKIKNSRPHAAIFDPVRFARLLSDRRQQLGLTTRQLAQRANVSQPYVVALERSRHGVEAKGSINISPSPTVDMIVRLANALQMDAQELFSLAIQPAGKHILLLMEDDTMTSLQRARSASKRSTTSKDVIPQEWLCAGGSADRNKHKIQKSLSISLHRDIDNAYKPKAIASSLSKELSRHQAEISGCDIGIIFDEISLLMNHVNNPMSIVEFEHDWSRVVTDASQSVGAFAALNVCVYRIDNLLGLHNPAEVAQDLLRSHDNVWTARNKNVITGNVAAKRLLSLVRPKHISAATWSAHTNTVVRELQLSA